MIGGNNFTVTNGSHRQAPSIRHNHFSQFNSNPYLALLSSIFLPSFISLFPFSWKVRNECRWGLELTDFNYRHITSAFKFSDEMGKLKNIGTKGGDTIKRDY